MFQKACKVTKIILYVQINKRFFYKNARALAYMHFFLYLCTRNVLPMKREEWPPPRRANQKDPIESNENTDF